jgi:hypothetical protein
MKPDRVVFIKQDLQEAFDSMSEDDPIKKGLRKAIADISQNIFSGRQVKKNLIPKKYSELSNIWIYNLPSAWRLIYSITPSEVEIIGVVLDWMDHKDYEKLFNF